MTALDYLKSKERNVELGRKDSTRSWQPNITITLADNTVYPFKGLVDFAEPQVDPRTVHSPYVPKCRIQNGYYFLDSSPK